MSEEKLPPKAVNEQADRNVRQLLFFVVVLGAAIIWGINHPDAALRVLAVVLGFGGIVMVHEFGHFIVAKLGRIKVEAFSIGFPPVVLGIRKLKKGWRVRVLPKIGETPALQEGDSETEYQVGLFPVGGFVKMLGQSDTGSAEASQDPRSFANRPVWVRMSVIAAGVVFNAVSAIIIFMLLFMHGIDQKPAMVGDVVPNSPAYDAGLRPGDEVIEIDGERFLNFEAMVMAPALSAPNEPIVMVVRRTDGTEEPLKLIAEKHDGDGSGVRRSGISPAQTLTIEPQIARDPNAVEKLYTNYRLRPGDEIKALDGRNVATAWEFSDIEKNLFKSEASVALSRQWPPEEGQQPTMTSVTFPVRVGPTVANFRDELDLAHFGSMVPQLKVERVVDPPAIISTPKRVLKWFNEKVLRRMPAQAQEAAGLQKGDIILKIADQEYPTYRQLREVTTAYKGKELPIVVMRNKNGQPQTVEVKMEPKTDPASDRVVMRIIPMLDMDSPIVARTIASPGLRGEHLSIPSGAVITSVADTPVKSFFDIASLLQANAGKKITVAYEHAGQPGQVAFTVPELEPVHAQASLSVDSLPVNVLFADLTRKFKADSPIQAVQMGVKKAWQFVKQSYITLGRLFQSSVDVSALSGPVGIISMTYQVAGTSLPDYLYFLGLISSCLAVMNLLPLPVLDGGHIVILLIEKISGRPLNERVLAGAMYAGMAVLLALVAWITYNDVIRAFF